MEKKLTFSFEAKVWLYPGDAAWHFVSLPKELARKISVLQEGKIRRGWGAVKVKVTVGKTTWITSMFPDKKSETYLLPLKSEVRKKEGIMHGDTAGVALMTI